MKWIRGLAQLLFGPYLLYRIYSVGTSGCAELQPCGWTIGPQHDAKEFARTDDPEFRYLADREFPGEDAYCWSARMDGQLTSGIWFWGGDRGSKREEGFWPLLPGEAKVVQVTTHRRFRGRGIAPQLIEYATHEMGKLGFHRLFARVWHSNRASIRAFTKAGWSSVAYVVVLYPFRSNRRWCFVFKKRTIR